MIKTIIFLAFLFIIIALIFGISPLINLRRRWLRNKKFPLDWIAILKRNVPLYNRLPASLQKQLHGHINVLLAEKTFKGCGGLKITDEMKLTIAAQAALLLLNEQRNYFSKLRLILVYPNVFIANQTTALGDYYLEQKQTKAGESWRIGILVLSWENIKRDSHNWKDGHNIILHEFAHQLDQEGGNASGVPILKKKADYLRWGQVFRAEYEQLRRDVDKGLKTVMDAYGATEPAEFFAVATEAFFEKPMQMQRKHPELYDELRRYYQLDPTAWTNP
jgi:Mlc titration factor MtfA (ptsG expression regulator)